jgi:hypothetical protein
MLLLVKFVIIIVANGTGYFKQRTIIVMWNIKQILVRKTLERDFRQSGQG